MAENSNIKVTKSNLIWVGAIVLVVGCWLLNFGYGWFLLWQNTPSGNYPNAGVFGDMFGAVNALFSGLGIIGIVYAIHQQDQQLSIAREEVKTAHLTLEVALEDADKTKAILKEQQEHLGAQNLATKTQMIEGTLFRMLDNLNVIIEGINYEEKSGRERLRSIKNTMLTAIGNIEDEKELVESLHNYLVRNKTVRDNLSNYIRQLRFIIEYVNNSFDEGKIKFYRSYVKSSMSNSEILIVYYNALMDKKFERNALWDFVESEKFIEIVKHEKNN